MKIKYSKKLNLLPPYLFAEIDRKKKAAIDRGVKIISLGVGDPDLPTPEHIVESMQTAVTKTEYHQYPFGAGLKQFRQVVADWMLKRFNVNLDPNTEIHTVLGSKEAIGHFPLAFINTNDVVLIPEPAYPVYQAGTIFAGGKIHFMPLLEENGFLPDLEKIPKTVWQKAKVVFINYPNNPTGATANLDFYSKVVEYARKYDVIIAHDAAYSEMYYDDNNKPPSIFQIPNAKDLAIEFHSLSKTYNMTGWRIGWVCGNKEIVSGLSKVKDNYDSGVFNAIQEAGITALTGNQDCVNDMRKVYIERRDVLVKGLNSLGLKCTSPKATFYVWCKTPKGYSSTEFVSKLLDEAGIVCTPGVGFGPSGEGFVRFALTVSVKAINEALYRMKNLNW